MVMKAFRKNFGDGETWSQFKRGARKYRVRFWKKTCPWVCRPRQCAKAFMSLKKNKSIGECLNIDARYAGRFPEQKRWQ